MNQKLYMVAKRRALPFALVAKVPPVHVTAPPEVLIDQSVGSKESPEW